MEGILLNNFRHTEQHFEQLFEFLPIGMGMIDFETGRFLEVNKSLLKTTGYTKEEFLNFNFWDITPKEYEEQEIQQKKDLIDFGQFGPNEKEYIKKDGTKYPIKISGFSITKADGRRVVWGLIEDITLAKQHETIYKDNKELLEYIAIENSISKILRKIVKLAEKRTQDVMCSILLLDKEKRHLFSAAAPSLPDFYTQAINGVEIGEKIGSCGATAFKKQRVVVGNIDKHENWQNFLTLTNKANLHSCWSEPILSSKNEILGTFAIYSKTHKYPSDFEIKLIETYSNLVSKAVEKDNYTKIILEKQKELSQLFDNTQIGLMYISPKRVLIKANQKLADIFGYKNAQEMVGISMLEIHLSKETYEKFGKEYFTALKTSEKMDIEYQLKRKDGSVIWCEISGRAMNSEDFSEGVLWMIKDISLRKEYQTKLINSEILKTNILSTIPDLIWLKDKNGVYLSYNPAFEKAFLDEKESLIGKTDFDIVNEDLANEYKNRDKIAMNSSKTIISEEWITYKNKKEVLLETSKKAMRDQEGNILGVLSIGHDITQRKLKEEELKNLKQKAENLANSRKILLSLFDKGDAVLFSWKNDKNWTIEYASLSVSKLYGYTKEEFLSQKIIYSSCIHKEDLKTTEDEVFHGLEKNLDYFKHTPYRIITKDNEEKWVLDNTVTIKNKAGEITDFIAYIIDITEQIKNQELIFHQSKIASMGEMLGNISHQWRQPLSAISSLATGSRLKKELEMLDTQEFYDNMDLINKNAQYLSKTIDDFRNFFISDTNTKKDTNIKDTFYKIYALIKDSFKNSNIKTKFNIEDTIITINENIFIQAMLNILNNARDALTSNKNIEKKYVFIELVKNKEEYLLTIKDNAEGIPENIKNKIFEPYFTTKHKSQGTGIGLYMTNQIIIKHLQGEILVKNVTYTYKENTFKGACFEIKIPI